MSLNFYSVGLNHVGAYQVSGVPFITGSSLPATDTESLRFEFPNVTRKIIVKTDCNHSIRVHWAPYTASFGYSEGAQANNNFILVDSDHAVEFDVKCKEVFISATSTSDTGHNVQIYAELTNIPASRMFDLDGIVGVNA
jgi:hypothetical protein